MENIIDLHTHSTASDGTYSPAELVVYAAARHLRVLALTDHDTIDGLQEAAEEARRQGLIFIPGIEINIAWPTGEFHLLGLGLRRLSPELRRILRFLADSREERNRLMAQRLQEAGIPVTLEEVSAHFNTKMIGRPHFAQYMEEKGFVKQRQLAFDKYFAKGRPCFVERTGAELADAVAAIKSSGGVPVQAHPLSMYVSWGKIDGVMEEIRDKGVMGLEAWHPGVRVAEAERLEELGHRLGMIVTAGSDFHGEQVRADRKLGHSAGGKQIDSRFWEEELQPLLRTLHGGSGVDGGFEIPAEDSSSPR